MEAVHVAQYESDPSDEEIQDENNGMNRSQKRKRTIHWITEGVFDNAVEAKASGCEGEDWYTLTLILSPSSAHPHPHTAIDQLFWKITYVSTW